MKSKSPKSSSVPLKKGGLEKVACVLQVMFSLLVGVVLVYIGVVNLMLVKRVVKVKAMIHEVNVFPEPQNCDGVNKACLSLVFTHKSKDYTLRKPVMVESSQYQKGQVIDLYVNAKTMKECHLEDPNRWWDILFAVLLLLLGLVLVGLTLTKCWVKTPKSSLL